MMKKIFNFQFSIFNSKGFSLIELLISITIIGILGSIVLTSMARSRARAYDSKIKQQLSSLRTAAEIYLTNNGSYGPATADCSQAGSMFVNVDESSGKPGLYIAAGNLPDFTQVVCGSTNAAYAVKATLYAGDEYWCVDNKGASRLIQGEIGASTTFCP